MLTNTICYVQNDRVPTKSYSIKVTNFFKLMTGGRVCLVYETFGKSNIFSPTSLSFLLSGQVDVAANPLFNQCKLLFKCVTVINIFGMP